MLAVFIYGLGWMFLLSAIFGYDVSFINTLFISLFSYLAAITLFGNKKRSLISLAALSLLSVGGFFAMYLFGIKDLIVNNISMFLLPYIESITDAGSSIDIPRQVVVILLISMLIYIIIFKNKNSKFSGYAYILVSLITLAAGFVQNRLNSKSDRYVFLFFMFCSIIYYFYIFYRKNELNEKRSVMPFIFISIIYALSIIGISQLL